MKSLSFKLCLFLFFAAAFSGRANELGTLIGAVTGTVLVWPLYRRALGVAQIERRDLSSRKAK
jgi:hypothetical protein